MTRARAGAALLSIVLAGCTCGSGLETAGASHPYVRCAAADAPAPRELRTAAATVHVAGREVVVEPAGAPRLAVLAGPAVAGEPFEPALDALEAGAPSAILVVGALGDDVETARATLAALSSLDAPSFLLLGGRDRPEVVEDALAALDEPARGRIVDLSGVRRVRLGVLVLVPAPGAPDGRYAAGDDACGLGPDDVDAITSDLGAAGDERRVLLSWAAPADGGARTAGIAGGEAGSALVADLAARVGASGWIASFGASGAARASAAPSWDVAIAAPLAVGVTERDDGGHFSGAPLLLEVGDAGLCLVVP